VHRDAPLLVRGDDEDRNDRPTTIDRSSPVSSASDTSTSTFRVRDGRQRGRTDETGAEAGTGTVVSFAVRRSPGLCGVAMRAATRWNMQGVTVTDNAA
jgi:hypothetical protein